MSDGPQFNPTRNGSSPMGGGTYPVDSAQAGAGQWNPVDQPGQAGQAGAWPPPPAPGSQYGYDQQAAGAQYAYDQQAGRGQNGGQVDHPNGVAIFVLGLVSLLVFQPLGFVPWFMGNSAQREIDARPGLYRNTGLVTAGRILGIIAAVITILAALLFILIFILGIAIPLLAI